MKEQFGVSHSFDINKLASVEKKKVVKIEMEVEEKIKETPGMIMDFNAT